ncbi:putative oxygen-independent coproporphyrinogen III oxidase [Acetomicrobium mobile DSM 13181]|uniref:Heme chaperone HemW n=1 Tax=Acetomicrobium mobile (strain ATCC BAA-54 / DSM 13181 / JCM 12221 / NGA) TaxID=891968 RepID=I4BWI1_ACEMN|nr:putative oxygen-independent coproporphyrinogen III oxidase [Acetomicrobium mobile DSM 13181]
MPSCRLMRKNKLSGMTNGATARLGWALSCPLSLYVHIPFCVRKCPYCAFYSITASPEDMDKYLDALGQELQLWTSLSGDKLHAQTLYIGGGTPTVLSAKQWEKLILILERYVDFLPFLEASVEANPGSLRADHIRLWRSWKITRVSLGAQSLDEGELNWLRRPHNAYDVADSLAALVASGQDVSVDLLFGLPGQTIQSWHRTIKDCLRFGIRHLSIYELTLEENTPWGENPPKGLTASYPLYRFAQWYLPKRGFTHYEIASFSLPGHWCRHNIAYWQGENFLGIGASAWGYLDGYRYGNVKDIKIYVKKISEGKLAIADEELLPTEQAARESAVLALRTMWGVSGRFFRRRWGWKAYRDFCDTWRGLPEDCKITCHGRYALSPKGFRVANSLWEEFL